MKIEESRPGVFVATMTAHEISALVAGAKLSLSVMEADPSGAEAAARETLAKVVADFDAAAGRLRRERGERAT